MNNSSLTLQDVFFTPGEKTAEHNGNQWDKLESRIKEEIKGIKWTASAPELTKKAGELLNINIPDILIESWQKEQAIQKLIKESAASPGETFYIELIEHTIKSEHHPYIEIIFKEIPVKKIEFLLFVLFKLKGFVLKIKEGIITEIQTGSCEIEGEFTYQDIKLAKKAFSPLTLPGVIQLS